MASVELRRFSSADACNADYRACPMPADPPQRHRLMGCHLAMRGLADDLTGAGASMTVDFLPEEPPLPGEPARVGTVVAGLVRRAGRGGLVARGVAGDCPAVAARLSEVRAILDAIPGSIADAVNADSVR